MSDSAFPDCVYRADLDMCTVRWPTHERTATIRSDYDTLLQLPETRRTARWLLDVRRRPHTSVAVAQWVINDWLLRAAALLPTPLRVAFLVAPTRAAELADDTAMRAVVQPAARPGLPYQMYVFTNEGEAMAWLLG